MKNVQDFSRFLSNVAHVSSGDMNNYLHWVKVFREYFPGGVSQRETAIEEFMKKIGSKYPDWKVRQAVASVKLYWNFLDRDDGVNNLHSAEVGERVGGTDKITILDEVRRMLRLMHRSYKTELSYLGWTRRFLEFFEKSRQSEAGSMRQEITALDLKKFLTHLAVEERIASTTQQQAFNALLFLFRHVLHITVDGLSDTVRAFRKRRLPVVLTV